MATPSTAELPEFFKKLFLSHFDFPKNFPDESASQVASGMIGNSCCPAIRMAIKNMASFQPYQFKPETKKDAFHFTEAHYRQPTHTATSICCNPTKRGRS